MLRTGHSGGGGHQSGDALLFDDVLLTFGVGIFFLFSLLLRTRSTATTTTAATARLLGIGLSGSSSGILLLHHRSGFGGRRFGGGICNAFVFVACGSDGRVQ